MVASPPGTSNTGTHQGRLPHSGHAIPHGGAGSAGRGPLPLQSEAVDSPATPETVSSRTLLADLLELTKPRIVMMILVTASVAAVIAGGTLSPWLFLHLLIGVALVAGSAGAMNQIWEYRIDGQMERTRRRPLPAGRLGLPSALAFASALGVVGLLYLTIAFGPVPALLALATWVLYVPIYTPLKVRSEWNTTVGAVSGALPVMIGYTAAGGLLSDVSGWLLVGVLVAWQYPHFMAIAWLFRRQYAEAGFQMTTTVEPTGRRAGWQSVIGMVVLMLCLISLAVILTPSSLLASIVLSVIVLAVTYPMTAAAVRFASRRDDLTARRLLRASLLQLPASLLLLTCAAILFGQ
jgi:heme o synthase